MFATIFRVEEFTSFNDTPKDVKGYIRVEKPSEGTILQQLICNDFMPPGMFKADMARIGNALAVIHPECRPIKLTVDDGRTALEKSFDMSCGQPRNPFVDGQPPFKLFSPILDLLNKDKEDWNEL